MTDRNKEEFESIVSDIILNKDFNRLNKDMHHGITRYEHSMRVAKYSYIISKKLKLDKVEDITRAALLHDFYINEDLEDLNETKKLKAHPKIALENSLKYYDLTDIQKDIIVNHMFPVTHSLPKHKESWLVSLVDKGVGTYELLRFKAPLYASIYLLFLLQILYFKVM